MARGADGARIWSAVLSELAQVPVAVVWDAPAWRVRWTDGPTPAAVIHRVEELATYRIGRPLEVAALRFHRADSAAAVALAWLRVSRPSSPGQVSDSLGEVEALCARTAYPLARSDPPSRAAAQLLAAVAQQDRGQMGVLLAAAVPPVGHLVAPAGDGPALPGRVMSYRWPAAGPPRELLGFTPPASTMTRAPSGVEAATSSAVTVVQACARCGIRLSGGASRGRPEKYCSGRCRTAAYRARRKNVSDLW